MGRKQGSRFLEDLGDALVALLVVVAFVLSIALAIAYVANASN